MNEDSICYDGYDDEYFQECRNALRKHHLAQTIPHYSIYEKEGRMTDYELFNFIQQLAPPKAHSNYGRIETLPINHLGKIDCLNNSYCGQTLNDEDEEKDNTCLKTLKANGIETIVDLVGFPGYSGKVENAGLNYFKYPIDSVLSSELFESMNDDLDKKRRLCEEAIEDGINIDIDSNMESAKRLYLNNSKVSIEKFTDFISLMRNGNLYIGCGFGTQRKQYALLLNNAFNPLCFNKPLEIPPIDTIRCSVAKGSGTHISFQQRMIKNFCNLYDKLSQEDKAKMG